MMIPRNGGAVIGLIPIYTQGAGSPRAAHAREKAAGADFTRVFQQGALLFRQAPRGR
jgi:hypothetical protein